MLVKIVWQSVKVTCQRDTGRRRAVRVQRLLLVRQGERRGPVRLVRWAVPAPVGSVGHRRRLATVLPPQAPGPAASPWRRAVRLRLPATHRSGRQAGTPTAAAGRPRVVDQEELEDQVVVPGCTPGPLVLPRRPVGPVPLRAIGSLTETAGSFDGLGRGL
ncbi:hypothetical protein KNE206_53930 [Kitasatospora sp. NE20-6]